MPDTSKVEVLFYKASSGAIFCLQGVGATLQIRFGDLLCIRLTCMAIAKLITFSVNASDSVYFSRRTDPVKRGMDDQLYHAFTFDPSKSLLQRYYFSFIRPRAHMDVSCLPLVTNARFQTVTRNLFVFIYEFRTG